MKSIYQQRFWDKVGVRGENDCWEWLAGKSGGNGAEYGRFWMRDSSGRMRQYGAHRLCYEWEVGQIPEGQHVLHRCDNPGCVNPKHLFVGTPSDNISDSIRKGRFARGEDKQKSAKLSAEDVVRIREMTLFGAKQCDLAHVFNVSTAQISHIVSKRSWAHVS